LYKDHAMTKLLRIKLLPFFVLPFPRVHTVNPLVLSDKAAQPAISGSMTINQFLSIDPDQIRKSNVIKQAWVKRWAIRPIVYSSYRHLI